MIKFFNGNGKDNDHLAGARGLLDMGLLDIL